MAETLQVRLSALLHRPLVYWIISGGLATILPVLGVPFVATVLIAAPFAVFAGWFLVVPPKHECGWCGRRFTGTYDWCCPTCAETGEKP